MAEMRKRYTQGSSQSTQTQYDQNEMPDIQNVTEEQKEMSLKEKIQLIDQEILLLRSFCLQSGYSQGEIESCASPLLDFLTTANRKKCLSKVLKLVLILSVGFFLYKYDPAYNMIRVGARQMQLQTLPYWDWTHWFDDNCIVNNPFYQEERLSKSDCEGCADIDEIEREEELTHDDMAQTFLLAYIPLIITDAIQDWKAYKIFDTEYVTKLFLEDPVLSAGTICSFYNENVKHKYVKDVLRSIDNGTTTQWNMHWQNCMDTARKTFRRFYSRPYCIPPMVEMMNSNWLFMSSGVNKQQLSKLPYVRSLDTGVSMTWFAQLKGSYEIKLKPHEICEEDCEVMTAILQPGELLVFSNIMWKFEFRVASEKDVIAIAANGNWD